MPEPELTGLPTELLDDIFSHLSLTDCLTVYNVCKRLRNQVKRSMSTCKHGYLDVIALTSRQLGLRGVVHDWSNLETLTLVLDPREVGRLAEVTTLFQTANEDRLTVHCHFTVSRLSREEVRPIETGTASQSLSCRTLVISGPWGRVTRSRTYHGPINIKASKDVVQILNHDVEGHGLPRDTQDPDNNGPDLGIILLVQDDVSTSEDTYVEMGLSEHVADLLNEKLRMGTTQRVTLACQEPWSEEDCAKVAGYLLHLASRATDILTVRPLPKEDSSILGDALRLYYRDKSRGDWGSQ